MKLAIQEGTEKQYKMIYHFLGPKIIKNWPTKIPDPIFPLRFEF